MCTIWIGLDWTYVHSIAQEVICTVITFQVLGYPSGYSPYHGLELPAWYIIVDIIVLTYAIDELHARYLVTHQVIVHTMAYDVTKPPRGEYTSTWWCDTISKSKGSLGFVKI